MRTEQKFRDRKSALRPLTYSIARASGFAMQLLARPGSMSNAYAQIRPWDKIRERQEQAKTIQRLEKGLRGGVVQVSLTMHVGIGYVYWR